MLRSAVRSLVLPTLTLAVAQSAVLSVRAFGHARRAPSGLHPHGAGRRGSPGPGASLLTGFARVHPDRLDARRAARRPDRRRRRHRAGVRPAGVGPMLVKDVGNAHLEKVRARPADRRHRAVIGFLVDLIHYSSTPRLRVRGVTCVLHEPRGRSWSGRIGPCWCDHRGRRLVSLMWTPYDPRRSYPGQVAADLVGPLFGTDAGGEDLFSRSSSVPASRLLVSLASVLIAGVVGLALGVSARSHRAMVGESVAPSSTS